MKFGIRKFSLKKRISARTSLKRIVRSKIRVPRGMGVLTNPKKAMYNRVYNRTSMSVDRLVKGSGRKTTTPNPLIGQQMTVSQREDGSIDCPSCGKNMGQPKVVGFWNQKKEYTCECGIKATVKV